MLGNKILLVEDDESIRESTKDLLEQEGYSVHCAKNGEEAIQFLSKNEELPALILLDLMMPVKDGYQFRLEQQANPQWASIPVVILTADGHAEEKKEKLGALAYIKKPADIATILSVVKRSYTSRNPPPSKKTVVIVDDSLDLTQAYQQALELDGFSVYLAGSGPDALVLLRQIPPPHLLLVDCLMPGMSGVDFLKALKKENPEIFTTTPIVGMSGLFVESSQVQEMTPLVSKVANKPNDLDAILKLVKESLR